MPSRGRGNRGGQRPIHRNWRKPQSAAPPGPAGQDVAAQEAATQSKKGPEPYQTGQGPAEGVQEPAQQQAAAESIDSIPLAQGKGKGKEKEEPAQQQAVAEPIPVVQGQGNEKKISWADATDEDIPLASDMARCTIKDGNVGGPSAVQTARARACKRLETPLSTESAEALKAKYWTKWARHSTTYDGCGPFEIPLLLREKRHFASKPQVEATQLPYGLDLKLVPYTGSGVSPSNKEPYKFKLCLWFDDEADPNPWINGVILFGFWEGLMMFRDQLSGPAPISLSRFLDKAWHGRIANTPARVAALAERIGIPLTDIYIESEVEVLEKAVREVLAQNTQRRQKAIVALVRKNEAGLQTSFKTRMLIALKTWREATDKESELEMIDLAIDVANEF